MKDNKKKLLEQEIIEDGVKVFLDTFKREKLNKLIQFEQNIKISLKTGFPFKFVVYDNIAYITTYIFVGVAELLAECKNSNIIIDYVKDKIVKKLDDNDILYDANKIYSENIIEVKKKYKTVKIESYEDIEKLKNIIENEQQKIEDFCSLIEEQAVNIKDLQKEMLEQIKSEIMQFGKIQKRFADGRWG